MDLEFGYVNGLIMDFFILDLVFIIFISMFISLFIRIELVERI